jgi:uncharacterized protein with von Willebrand factor type A (vWA) domain
MKRFPPLYGIIALAALLATGCGERQTTGTTEIPVVEDTSAANVPPQDREPIQNTTPENSSMDPSSNAYIVFDGSGSMAGQPIEQAKRAVAAFIAGAPEDLNIGLYVFDNAGMDGREVTPLGRGPEQRQMLKDQISRIEAGGGTPLGSAIEAGTHALIKQFQKQLRYGDIRLIVVTDGAASDSRVFNRSISFAGEYNVPIYTVGFRIGDRHPLRQFSEAYFTADDEKELLDAMEETLAEMDDSTALDL